MAEVFTLTRPPLKAGASVMPEKVEGPPLFADHGDVSVFMITSQADRDRFDELPGGATGKSVKVKNLVTGQTLKLRRGACGLGCYCGAEVVKAVE